MPLYVTDVVPGVIVPFACWVTVIVGKPSNAVSVTESGLVKPLWIRVIFALSVPAAIGEKVTMNVCELPTATDAEVGLIVKRALLLAAEEILRAMLPVLLTMKLSCFELFTKTVSKLIEVLLRVNIGKPPNPVSVTESGLVDPLWVNVIFALSVPAVFGENVTRNVCE